MQTIKLGIVLATLLALVHATLAPPPARYRDYDIFIDSLENGITFRIAEEEDQLVKLSEQVSEMEQRIPVHKEEKDHLLQQIDSLVTLSKNGVALVENVAREDLKPKFGPLLAQIQMLSQEFSALEVRVKAIKV